MMDLHDMDDFGIACGVDHRIQDWGIGSEIFGQGRSKAGSFAFTLPRRSFRTYDRG